MEALCCYSFMWYNTIMLESKRHTGRREKTKSSHHLKWLFPLFLFSQGVLCSPSWQFCTMRMTTSVFLPHCGIAALPHFFGKCHTYNIIPRTQRREKTYYKTYVLIRTFPYNISQNLIGYRVFRKHPISWVNFI